MRNIHIHIDDPKNITYQLTTEDGVSLISLRNASRHQILLLKPKLRRALTGGVFIEDTWGSFDKYFSDKKVSREKHW